MPTILSRRGRDAAPASPTSLALIILAALLIAPIALLAPTAAHAASASPAAPAGSAHPADTIYHGGPILTIDEAMPQAEALAVRDGLIIAVGDRDMVLEHRGDATRMVDLAGQTLLPGFVDSHGHAFMVGLQALSANMLPQPDGGVDSVDRVVETLTAWAEAFPERVDKVGWIVGFGYDDAQLAEQRHPTRHDLDRVSTELPVIIIHQSGHLGVGNTRALELAGITADTEDPEGGAFRREDDGRTPNGVAEEYAFFAMLYATARNFDDQVNDAFVREGAALLASFGYTTAQEGRATMPAVRAMERVASRGGLPIDVVVYPDILEVDDIRPTREYRDRLRIGGAKLTIDGSPQGKTAWLSRPYFVPPPGRKPGYRGYAAISEQTAYDAVAKAWQEGWQLLCHANGDAAIDLFLAAVAEAERQHLGVDNRPVLIHGQTLRADQVPLLDALGVFPSLFPMHTFYWGDWHRESVLGPERAEDISPTGWILARGMRFGTHHDAPVALPSSVRVLSATVTRRSRTGDILGPQHRVPVATALRAMTLWSAWQHFEEDTKGSLEVGKLADLVILSDNPLTVPEDQLDDLVVVRTIKEDAVVYERSEDRAALDPRLGPAPLGAGMAAGVHPGHTEHAHGHGAAAHAHGTAPLAEAPWLGHGCSADGCFSHAVGAILAGLADASERAARR
jgi:predicted amidohydrolase YtcJ